MIVELYRFVIGTERFLYTTAQRPVTHQGEEYDPVYIRRDAVKGTSELARAALKIRMPRDAAFAARFAPAPPTDVAEVEIFQQDDVATAAIWVGRVLTVARKGSEAVADCEPIHTSLRRAGLRRHYQKRCPHTLYDDGCRAPRQDFRVEATLTAVNGTALTAAEFDAQPDGFFTGGDVELGSLPERRAIIDHVGDTITLNAPIADAAAGDAITAFAGCDHSFATCVSKFANEENYGGMPFIPTKNPFGSDPVF